MRAGTFNLFLELPRNASTKCLNMSPHGAFRLIRLMSTYRLENSLVLLLEAVAMIGSRKPTEPKPQRPFRELSQFLGEFRVLGSPSHEQMKFAIERHHRMNAAVRNCLTGSFDDIGQTVNVNVFRSNRGKTGTLSLVDHSDVD